MSPLDAEGVERMSPLERRYRRLLCLLPAERRVARRGRAAARPRRALLVAIPAAMLLWAVLAVLGRPANPLLVTVVVAAAGIRRRPRMSAAE